MWFKDREGQMLKKKFQKFDVFKVFKIVGIFLEVFKDFICLFMRFLMVFKLQNVQSSKFKAERLRL